MGKQGKKTTTSPPTATNINTTTSTNSSLFIGKYLCNVDDFMIVSKYQSVFDEFYKALEDQNLVAAFEKMAKICDLN